MKKYKDIVAGAVLLAASIFYYIQTLSIKKIAFIDPVVGSAFFPRVIAIILFACSIVLIVQGILSLRIGDGKKSIDNSITAQAEEAENGKPGASSAWLNFKVVLVLLSFALFCFFMDKIGFAPSAFLYLWSQMILMSSKKESLKRILFYGALSLVLTACIYAMFRYGFCMILPRAKWF